MTKRRQKIPVRAANSEAVGCSNCEALCCRAMTFISLNDEERRRNLLRFSLEPIRKSLSFDVTLPPLSDLEPERYIPAGIGQYVFKKDCGNLTEDNRCGVYDQVSPVKPSSCSSFEEGGLACLIIRAAAGYQDEMPAHIRPQVDQGVEDVQKSREMLKSIGF